MKKTIIFLSLLFMNVCAFAQAPEWQWTEKAGGSGDDGGSNIIVDSLGNSYVTGSFTGTAVFGDISLDSNGDGDIFIAKLNSNGVWQWAKKAGGSGYDCGQSIIIDPNGNSYVTGYFSGMATFGSSTLTSYGSNDIFVAKLNSSGVWQWAKKAGGSSNDYSKEISIDSNGNSYITGTFEGNATFGSLTINCSSGYSDIFVAKLNFNGDWQWVKQAGGSSWYDRGYSISVDSNGNLYVTGFFYYTATFGSSTLTSYGNNDIFVAKLNSNGDWLWVKQAGGIEEDWAEAIIVDSVGNSFITGIFEDTATFGSIALTSSGGYDVFIAKLNSNGDWQWAEKAGGSSNEIGYGISIDSNGNSYVTGIFSGTATFDSDTLTSSGASNDIFISKLNSNGDWQWVKQAGGSSSDTGQGISVDSNGDVYVSGQFYLSATFGDDTLISSGVQDIYVSKLIQFYTDFNSDNTHGYNTLEAHFTDLSGGNPTSWQWDFQNDGIYDSFEQNPDFLFNEIGIYDVKLKISNGIQADSLIKYNYITVEYVPPAPPDSVEVNVVHPDVVISWTTVDTTIFGTPITPDGYILLYNETPYEDEQFYYFLSFTIETFYTHIYVAQYREQMFYNVIAVVNFTREEIEYLESLSNSREILNWLEVQQNLNELQK